MRKLTIYSLAFTITLAAIGCTKELEITEPAGRIDQGGELIFFASNENDGVNVQTKTVLGSDGLKVTFVDNDKIKIYDGATNRDYTTNSTDIGTGLRMFSGSGLNADAASYYAVYPSTAAKGFDAVNLTATIPAVQTAPLGSFDPAANVSVAKGDKIETGKYNLKFKNVGNLLKFEFTADSEVTAIIIKGNGGESLAGTVTVNPVSAERTGSITSGSNQVTLKPAGGGTFKAGSYYAVVIPQTFPNGVSVKMEHGSGSYHFKRGSVENLTMARNKIYKLFSGSLADYAEAAVLPSLYAQASDFNGGKYGTAYRISFHSMAQDVDWDYANAKNQLHIIGDSDVRGYLEDGTLHIWTKKAMFSIPEEDVMVTSGDGTHMFENFKSVTAIDNLSYLDVTFLKHFNAMFRGCNALTSLDISGWDTSSAVSMLGMFNVDAASPLTDIILGEWFVLTDPGNNLFGTGTSERTNKIRVSCPENVYTQFENYSSYATGNEEYKKQVTWNHGSSAENFGEFLNPTIAVTSVSRTVNFTFTLGGYFDSEALTTIQVGFDGYTPADMTTFSSDGKQTIDGIEYDMYTITLTAAQKHDRRLIAQVIAQATEKDPTHVIMMAGGFTTKKFESRIYPYAFSGDVQVAPDDGLKASTNFISGVATSEWKDYSGNNWPIAGQACKVTFYLKVENGMKTDAVYLSNGSDAYPCVKAGSGAPAGYTAWTTNEAIVVSNTCEAKELKVLVQVEGQRMLHNPGNITVNVYGITLGSGMTTTATFSANTSDVYVIKSNTSGRFLFTDGNLATSSVRTKAQDIPDNFCFWKFDPASSPVKLLTYNTSTQRYLTSGFQASDRSGNAVGLTVSDGLRFANGTSGGKTKYMREATVNSASPTSVSLATTDGQNEWTVFPVTFTDPRTL